MREEKIEKLLGELAEATTEAVSPNLAENVKKHIPHTLAHHRRGMDTIKIMIDLRISKLAAAAVIIIATALSISLFDGQDSTDKGFYQDSKLLIKYCMGFENVARHDVLAGMSNFYKNLIQKEKEVVFYSESFDSGESDSILMHWKLSDDKYRVIFGDLHAETVNAEKLIKLQTHMLQKK